METKREDLKIEDILLDVIEDKDVMEEAEGLLAEEQVAIVKKLKNNEFSLEDRMRAYKAGFTMSEIGKVTGYTRASISKYLKSIESKSEAYDVEDKHKENRERLDYFKKWYLYVYKSDEVGDYHQMMKYLFPSMRRDGTAYNFYLEYGGNKLERKGVDKRQVISEQKEQRILEELEKKSLEQVSFQERLLPDNVERIAEKEGVEVIREVELTGSTHYTEKLNRWLKKKEEYNRLGSKKKSESGKEEKEDKNKKE